MISDVLIGKGMKQPSIILGVPVRDRDGHFIGAVNAALDLLLLQKLLRRLLHLLRQLLRLEHRLEELLGDAAGLLLRVELAVLVLEGRTRLLFLLVQLGLLRLLPFLVDALRGDRARRLELAPELLLVLVDAPVRVYDLVDVGRASQNYGGSGKGISERSNE